MDVALSPQLHRLEVDLSPAQGRWGDQERHHPGTR